MFFPRSLLSAQPRLLPAYLVLSIDGGGFKGLACLFVLAHLMVEISGGDDEDALIHRPCQIFDLICGTSTGGLIAILLGRFGLSCEEAIDVYREVGATMFGGEANSADLWRRIIEGGQLSPTMFERKLEDLAEKYTGRKDALFRPLKSAPDTVVHESTKVSHPPFTCATSFAWKNTTDVCYCRVENWSCWCRCISHPFIFTAFIRY